MRNTLTIFRRDFAAYFTSPIGYIFMLVFLFISVKLLYLVPLINSPVIVADMRMLFELLPFVLSVFIPAVTMRIWAEERKENTWELLLTFPMRGRELVLGKFFAALAFYAITLATTVTVPLMLARLGNPDMGAILGGYIGALLLGAMFLALGIFFSGFCKDQIVAFVVTLLACIIIVLLGWAVVAGRIDRFIPGLGSTLARAVGIFDHYQSFGRGVVDTVNIFYFLVWTILFLVLNMLYIEGRNRPGVRLLFGTAVGLCLVIGLLFNWLIQGQSLGRMDLTEQKIHTVSPATRRILSELDGVAQVRLYITPRREMPTELNTLQQSITDKLEEMRVASGGQLDYSVVELQAANVLRRPDDPVEEKDEEEEALERRVLDKGVEPFPYGASGADQFTRKWVYSSIGISYREKPEQIIPHITPQDLDKLEYVLVSTIAKITREHTPVIALVAPKDSIPAELRQMFIQQGQPLPVTGDPYGELAAWLPREGYEVRRVDLTQDSPLPEEYDVLCVFEPENLDERQLYEINRAVVSGKPVILGVQHFEWSVNLDQDRLTITPQRVVSGVNALLEAYGLGVSEEILMDTNAVPLPIDAGPSPHNPRQRLMLQVTLPTQMLIVGDMFNLDNPITNWLSVAFYLWGTAIHMDMEKLAEHGLTTEVLMTTSDMAWKASADLPAPEMMAALEKIPRQGEGERYPIMVQVTGQFPDAYAGTERPDWPEPTPTPGMMPPPPPPDDGPELPLEPKPGHLVLLGAGKMFANDYLPVLNNADLLINTLDALAQGTDLLTIRGKQPVLRTIQKPDTRMMRFWMAINWGVVDCCIIIIGVALAVVRKRSRDAYTRAHIPRNVSIEK